MSPRQLNGALIGLVSSALAGVVLADHHLPAGANQYDDARALEISQAAIGARVGDYAFVDSLGNRTRLADFRGRPLVVSLIFTSCHHVCPLLTQHLAEVVQIGREALGEESFSVLTIGFDTAVDTPERMRSFARARGIGVHGWTFASADAETIVALTRDLGFIYFPSAKGFDHLAQTTVLDAEGRVHSQVYGQRFPPPALVEPLKQLVFGEHANDGSFSGWLDGVKLFCTIYDPSTGRYKFDYSIFVSLIVGLMCLGAIAIFVVRAWRESGPPGRSA